MGQPGQAGSQFPSEDALVRRVQDLERTVQQLAAANQLATAGISAVPDGIIVNGSETVNGPLTINGVATITGALNLPAGIIGNDALASPVDVGQTSASETNFGTALTDEDRAVTTIAVPAGYTRALVLCIVTAGVISSAGTIDFLFLSASINGAKSRELYSQAPAGGAAPPITTSKSSLLTGLSGGVITLAAAVHSQSNAWSANASSRAYVEAQAIFLR